jgi:hypothetical protein
MSYPRDHIIIRKSTYDVISSFGQERGTALLPLAYHNSGIFIKSMYHPKFDFFTNSYVVFGTIQ